MYDMREAESRIDLNTFPVKTQRRDPRRGTGSRLVMLIGTTCTANVMYDPTRPVGDIQEGRALASGARGPGFKPNCLRTRRVFVRDVTYFWASSWFLPLFWLCYILSSPASVQPRQCQLHTIATVHAYDNRRECGLASTSLRI